MPAGLFDWLFFDGVARRSRLSTCLAPRRFVPPCFSRSREMQMEMWKGSNLHSSTQETLHLGRSNFVQVPWDSCSTAFLLCEDHVSPRSRSGKAPSQSLSILHSGCRYRLEASAAVLAAHLHPDLVVAPGGHTSSSLEPLRPPWTVPQLTTEGVTMALT